MSNSPMWLRVRVYEQRDLLHVVGQCSSSAEKATLTLLFTYAEQAAGWSH